MSKDLELKLDIDSLLGRMNETKIHSLYKPQTTSVAIQKNKSLLEATTPIVELVMLFDRSDSMEGFKGDAIRGFNQFIADQQKIGNAKFTLVYFNHHSEMEYASASIHNVKPLDSCQLRCSGLTARDDSICITIQAMKAKLANRGLLDHQKVVFAILTDDCGSNEDEQYTHQDAVRMITEMKERYGWEFIYLGCHEGAEEVAKLYNINPKQAINADQVGMFEGIKQMSAMITDARE